MTHYVLKLQYTNPKETPYQQASAPMKPLHHQRVVAPTCLIETDDWQVDRNEASALNPTADLLAYPPYTILPLRAWLIGAESLWQQNSKDPRLAQYGVWFAPDDDVMQLAPMLAKSCAPALMAIDFPHWKDGRGYSQAYMLRHRLQWLGEIRAIGDVWRDQMLGMARSGIDVFAAANDDPDYLQASVQAFREFEQHYQADVWQPLPLFRRL